MKKTTITLLSALLFLGACKKPVQTENELSEVQSTSAVALSASVTPTMLPAQVVLLDGWGYNTRFPDVAAPWNNNAGQLWRTGLVNSAGNCIRYPGGTVANYWDANANKMFQKKSSANPGGWVDLAKVGPFDLIQDCISAGTQQQNTLADLKKAVDEGATPVFVLNLLTPGKDFYASPQGWNRTVNGTVGSADWYLMLDDRYNRSKQMLIKANAQGIVPKFIELGNEYYIANCPYNDEAYPTGNAYATAANYIANKIANDASLSFLGSNYRLSVPGVVEEVSMSSTRIKNWNSQMVPNLNRSLINAISIHTYEYPATVPATFNDTNIRPYVGSWLSQITSSMTAKDSFTQIVNNNWKSWWTEVSVGRPDKITSFPKWGNALAQVYASIWTFEQGAQLYMFGNLNSNRVVDPATGALKSTGYALKPLMQASRSKLRGRKLNLGAYEADHRLKGIVFQDDDVPGSNRRTCIVNLTNAAIQVDLSNVFPVLTNVTLSGVKHSDLNTTADPQQIANRTEPKINVTLDPYSVSFIRP